MYETLLEKEKDGTYFIDAYAVMDPSSHLVNTTNVPERTKFSELSHRTMYEDPRIVAWKLGLVQVVVRFRFHSVLFSFSLAIFCAVYGPTRSQFLGEVSQDFSGDPSRGFLGLSWGGLGGGSRPSVLAVS